MDENGRPAPTRRARMPALRGNVRVGAGRAGLYLFRITMDENGRPAPTTDGGYIPAKAAGTTARKGSGYRWNTRPTRECSGRRARMPALHMGMKDPPLPWRVYTRKRSGYYRPQRQRVLMEYPPYDRWRGGDPSYDRFRARLRRLPGTRVPGRYPPGNPCPSPCTDNRR